MAKRQKFFVITRVCRDDVKQALGYNPHLTDQEMQRIADKMADDYLNQLYWGSLKIIAEEIISRRPSP